MRLAFLLPTLLALAPPLHAQSDAPPLADLIGIVTMAEDKVAALAETMPADAWAWRPDDGVRSASEVVRHIAASNYLMPAILGVPVPEGIPLSIGPDGPQGMAEYEALTDRAEARDALAASFVHLRDAMADIPADRLDEPLVVFGRPMTVRGFALIMATHLHEHLGQLIAYARTNGVVPPWSDGS
ncbi:MAG: DinB family protein [Rubricoccaceae bacterium]|nr:DinB family protein [Rubricoccaceae bacterium]